MARELGDQELEHPISLRPLCFHLGGIAGADHLRREVGHSREATKSVSGVKRHQLVPQDHHRNPTHG